MHSSRSSFLFKNLYRYHVLRAVGEEKFPYLNEGLTLMVDGKCLTYLFQSRVDIGVMLHVKPL